MPKQKPKPFAKTKCFTKGQCLNTFEKTAMTKLQKLNLSYPTHLELFILP